jgi:CBS domain containing-hemolysin-like protein
MNVIGLIGFALLILTNGFFVAAEFALVKLRAADLETGDDSHAPAADTARHMLKNLDAYLSGCQLGITLASLGLGWIGEPVVARLLEGPLHGLGLPDAMIHVAAFALSFFLITFFHLTVGEQAPKIWAIQRARSTALAVARPLAWFYKAFKPFIWLINISSNGMLRMVGLEAVSEHQQEVTEDEVRVLMAQSATVGHLSSREVSMLENVLDLENKIARSFMVPRNEVVTLDIDAGVEESLARAAESGHTRLPVCRGDLDSVEGIFHVKDAFKARAAGAELSAIGDIMRPAVIVHESTRLDQLLARVQGSRAHMVILVDDFGSASGIITLENVLEQLVGPIQDEFDDEAPMVQRIGQDRFEVLGTCPVSEFEKVSGMSLGDTDSDTVGGVVVSLAGRIPVGGEKVTSTGITMVVLEAEPTKVGRVRVERS